MKDIHRAISISHLPINVIFYIKITWFWKVSILLRGSIWELVVQRLARVFMCMVTRKGDRDSC